VPMFRTDYWLDLAGASDLVLLTFSTPLLDAAAALLDLFDTIAATVDVPARGTPIALATDAGA
jgi:hypothetical protein